MKKLLLVFAHPDDAETIVSETVATYKGAGWAITSIDASQFGYSEGTLTNLTPGTLEDPIYRKMEEEPPDVVITFDTTGINNDPDHIKTCYATTYAFQKYAARLERMVTKRIEPKLYYVCAPQSAVLHAIRSRAIATQSHGKPWKGTPDDRITTVIGEEHFILRMQGRREHFMGKNDRISDRL